jgi:CheY-like chemotaxis protein
MDMQLPTLSGPDAAAAILAQRGDKPPVPIIALTANAFEQDRQRCVDAGMCDFLSKPISPTLLFERIGRWLGPTAVSA